MTRLLGIIRIRGYADTPWYIQDTLKMLRLPRRFNAMVYEDSPSIRGMLKIAEPYITWGELNEEGLKLLLTRLHTKIGNLKITDDILKSQLKIESYNLFVKKIMDGEIKLHKLDDYFKLPIRLHPPSGGFKGKINRPFGVKGEFGYRGEKINELIKRMV
ncbi:50S ribosomal protein L30 [Sulfurisphaera ohwakuensis]|uniref:Large ribosomal subunit protein uL30 n=1 Tax=Sulfurisphaera ohwakuensis TaxID=69656 RepID=A0A650CE58_SULOH|nr:50S ribosomal protein L30 [Sulfurisphaera ohwakuensis]MBB5253012.1 large subunit ribosomal protein L30 [Sulfurisphaera ohwakuensis]QGR16062.1 50S ribosomal protein L30 [Sulfurisphaera ohwakuensis]